MYLRVPPGAVLDYLVANISFEVLEKQQTIPLSLALLEFRTCLKVTAERVAQREIKISALF